MNTSVDNIRMAGYMEKQPVRGSLKRVLNSIIMDTYCLSFNFVILIIKLNNNNSNYQREGEACTCKQWDMFIYKFFFSTGFCFCFVFVLFCLLLQTAKTNKQTNPLWVLFPHHRRKACAQNDKNTKWLLCVTRWNFYFNSINRMNLMNNLLKPWDSINPKLWCLSFAIQFEAFIILFRCVCVPKGLYKSVVLAVNVLV